MVITCLHLNFFGNGFPCESAEPGDVPGVVELSGLVDQDGCISPGVLLDTVDVAVRLGAGARRKEKHTEFA